jgi:hypothetical protein
MDDGKSLSFFSSLMLGWDHQTEKFSSLFLSDLPMHQIQRKVTYLAAHCMSRLQPEECCLLGCGAVEIMCEPTFQRNMSPPSSGLKNP